MPIGSVKVSAFSFQRVFSSFSTVSRFHSHDKKGAIASGCSKDFNKLIVYCNSQITKYGRIGNIKEVESVFDRMCSRNTVTWTALLTAYAQNGLLGKARKVFDEMPDRSVASWNAMITAYTRSSLKIGEAYGLFSRMPERNAVSYAAMITGFIRAGMLVEAEKLYRDTPRVWRDPVCSNALLSGYLKMDKLDEAIQVFEGMEERDVVSWSSMVDGYCKKGMIDVARKLFDMMPLRNMVSWTSIIDGYMRYRSFKDGFELFISMKREAVGVGPFTLTILSEACANHSKNAEGYQIHGLVARMGFHHDIVLPNSMINMYGKFSCVDEAQKMFQEMNMKDVVSWNSLLASYVQAGKLQEAYDIFCTMPERDIVSLTTMIGGFSNKGDVAKFVHLFNMMPEKDDVAWTAVISGFENSGKLPDAIRWYIFMIRAAVQPNVMTLSSVISASAGMSNLIQGSQIHTHALKMNMDNDLSVQNALVTMYARCGAVSDAYQTFTNIIRPNVVSFNSMITGFAQHGFASESLSLFKKMQQIEGMQPNQITFLGVLSACKHIGLVEQGKCYFQQMRSIYGIEPGPNHYACMIDLLGRAGLFDQALDMMESMPFEPHSGVWAALLSASRCHLRPDLAKFAAEHLSELEPDNAAPYLLLSNTYSALGENNSEQVRVNRELRNSPGCSWIMN